MVPQDEAKIVEKGRLGPGEMLAVDMDQPQLYKDRELKDMLAETPRLRQLDDAHRRARLADQAGRAGRRAFRSRTSCAAGSSPPAGRSRISR